VEDAAMPLSPLEAATRVNEQVTVEMHVKAAKNCPHCSQIFLDSDEDHHDPKNLAVAVTEAGKPRFKDIGIDDPAGHFKGQVIRVTGMVTFKANRLQIEVNDPKQVELVETKE
jgi:DNA/RNA endonuclease YhcR with UshA esterase domain